MEPVPGRAGGLLVPSVLPEQGAVLDGDCVVGRGGAADDAGAGGEGGAQLLSEGGK